MLLRPRQRNRRNALARIGSSKPIARPEKPRARGRGGARAGTDTGTRPSGAQAGQQASRFTPFSKPREPGTSGYGSRSRLESARVEWLRTRFLADEELA
jgi:hypothetical protein